jgi:acid phosphatase family membrane protein YuiD
MKIMKANEILCESVISEIMAKLISHGEENKSAWHESWRKKTGYAKGVISAAAAAVSALAAAISVSAAWRHQSANFLWQ